MSQYPQDQMQGFEQPSQLPYAGPYVPSNGLPTSVKVISIIGICLGGLTLINHALGIALFLNMKNEPNGQGFVQYNIISSVVFGFFAIICLAASIGCLLRMEWARRLPVFAFIYLKKPTVKAVFGSTTM